MAPLAREARQIIAEWSKEGLELELASGSKTGFKDIILLVIQRELWGKTVRLQVEEAGGVARRLAVGKRGS